MNTEENLAYGLESTYLNPYEIEDIECAKEFLSDVVEAIYGKNSLEEMESSLEEACAHLKVPFPNKEMTITKKNRHVKDNPYFQFGVALSKQQAKIIFKTKIGEKNEN